MSETLDFSQALHADNAPPGARSAALLLHSVDTADQQWLLSQLAPSQQAQVQALLEELILLGVPADRKLLREAIAGQARNAAMSTDVEDPVEVLAGLPGDQIGHVLENEPDELIATLLLQRSWPWQEALLLHLGNARRSCIVNAMHAAGSSSRYRGRKLDEALVQCTLNRLARCTPPSAMAEPVAVERGITDRLRHWVKRTAARVSPGGRI